MKTYPIDILRKSFFDAVDTKKYSRVSVYLPGKKSFTFKGKPSQIFADHNGMFIHFTKVWVKRHRFYDLHIHVKDIRWLSNPFDKTAFENFCKHYTKKLQAPANG